MKNKSSLGKDAFYLSISKFLSLFISIIAGMILVRIRTVKEYGTYSQLILVIDLVTTIIMMGLPNSLNFFLARTDNNEEKDLFLSNYYTICTCLSIGIGIILFLGRPIIVDYFRNEQIEEYIYFLVLFPWTKIICASVENVLIVFGKTLTLIIYRLLNSIARLGIIIFVWIFKWSFNTYIFLYLIQEVFFTIWVYLIARKQTTKFSICFEKNLIKRVLVFSMPIGLASIVGTLNIELDKLVLGHLLSTEDLAIYTNASKEMPVTIISSSITAVLLPQMTRLIKRGKNKEAVFLWSDATILSYCVISFLAFALIAFAPEVITILYSTKYISGVSVFRIYSIVLLLRCTYWGMVLNATGNTKLILFSAICSLILNIALNFLLYSLIGYIGPAIATLLTQLILNMIQVMFTSRVINIQFKDIMRWKELGIITIINLLFMTFFYKIKTILSLDLYFGSLLEAILLGVIWFTIEFLLFRNYLFGKWKTLNNQ